MYLTVMNMWDHIKWNQKLYFTYTVYWLWKPVTPGLLIFFYDLSKVSAEIYAYLQS